MFQFTPAFQPSSRSAAFAREKHREPVKGDSVFQLESGLGCDETITRCFASSMPSHFARAGLPQSRKTQPGPCQS